MFMSVVDWNPVVQHFNGAGPVVPVEIPHDNVLSTLYHLIGCDLVERVILDQRGAAADLWVDEEGLLKNDVAPNRSWSFRHADGAITAGCYDVVGHAIALGADTYRGEIRTPTVDEIAAVMQLASYLAPGGPNLGQVAAWVSGGAPWRPIYNPLHRVSSPARAAL